MAHNVDTTTPELALVRDLTLFSMPMVGANIFALTGIGYGWAALMLAFILNSIATILTAMVYAELGYEIRFVDHHHLYVFVVEADEE